MAKIHINNPKQVINGGAKKYYFKVKGLGGPKGDKGDTGATGPQGPQGPQGNAATVSVGSTTTLPVGYDATVENVGSIYNAVLNFGIPQGPRGPQGATGAKGDKGDKGDQGNPGPQGEKGTNATVTVGTTTTTGPGTQAYAWNSSSNPNNAVINFNIPRGATGATGATGPQGPTGPAGADGADGQDGQNFTPTIVETLPTTGDQSKLYLTPKAHTTSTATGNPIEATVTEQAGQLESFQLDGDTFQQSYTGKNLADISNLSVNSYTGMTPNIANLVENTGSFDLVLSGAANESLWSIFAITPEIQLEPNTKYTLSRTFNTTGTAYAGAGGIRVKYSSSYTATSTADYITFLTDSTGKAQLLFYAAYNQSGPISSVNSTVSFANVQLEKSSTATSFEPCTGGQPSPSPDFPQQIQTVTGLQTISINGTNYPLDLGSIELCKLGTYQDYIYKDGEDWKVHKATNKITVDGSENWVYPDSGANYTFFQFSRNNFRSKYGNAADFYASNTEVGFAKADKFEQIVASSANMRTKQGIGFSTEGNGWFRISVANTIATTADAFKTWLSSHSTTIDYALATPTDTTITDQTLIAQLDAIRTASLENGTNTITNTATGTNLAGDMEIGYYGFNPTNRYDKFIWLDLNNNYEQIGGE